MRLLLLRRRVRPPPPAWGCRATPGAETGDRPRNRPRAKLRTTPFDLHSLCQRGGVSQCELKRRPFADLALRPDSSAMFANYPGDDGQPDASAFKFLGPMQTLKYAKQPVGIFHVQTDS